MRIGRDASTHCCFGAKIVGKRALFHRLLFGKANDGNGSIACRRRFPYVYAEPNIRGAAQDILRFFHVGQSAGVKSDIWAAILLGISRPSFDLRSTPLFDIAVITYADLNMANQET